MALGRTESQCGTREDHHENEPGLKVEVPLSSGDVNEIADDETKIARMHLANTKALLLSHVLGTDKSQ